MHFLITVVSFFFKRKLVDCTMNIPTLVHIFFLGSKYSRTGLSTFGFAEAEKL